MRTRGLWVVGTGAVLIGASFLAASMIVDSDFSGPGASDIESMFEGMFDDVADGMLVMPGDYAHASFDVASDDALVMWAVQITDYRPGDTINISIYDSDEMLRDASALAEPIQFDVVESVPAGTLRFEVQNSGDDPIEASVMFSENPDDSEMFADPNSPLNRVIVPLVVVGILALVGLAVVIVGIVIFLMDMKKRTSMNRFGSSGYDDRGYDERYGDGR